MIKTVIQLETLTCPSCVAKIEKSISKIVHVTDVEVGFNSSRVYIKSDQALNHNVLLDMITKLGFNVIKIQ